MPSSIDLKTTPTFLHVGYLKGIEYLGILDYQFGQEEYRRKISRVLEGLYRTGKPIIVLDTELDELTAICTFPTKERAFLAGAGTHG